MNNLLANRVAIVTGAGRGLGRSHALALAREGAGVVVNDLDADAAQETCEEIERGGSEAMWDRTDVQELNEAEEMVSKAIGRWGQADILVNNAGILRPRQTCWTFGWCSMFTSWARSTARERCGCTRRSADTGA